MKENSLPIVSVIIPAHNYANYLAACINSVLAQVGDNFRLEIIVVDDSSTDDTPEVARRFGDKIIYVRQENKSLSLTRNAGIRRASGKYMMFLDADDLIAPGTIAAHLDNFASRPGLDISICPCLYFYPAGSKEINTVWPLKSDELDLHLCHSIISPVHAFLLKREIAGQTLFFDPETKIEDHEYWLRCAITGANFASTTSGLVLYRWHDKGLSKKYSQHEEDGAILRQKKMNCLEKIPGFPKAGKFLGWLAFAAGVLRHATFSQNLNVEKTRELLTVASTALLRARKHFRPKGPDTAYRCLAGEYYAALILSSRQLFWQFKIPGSEMGLETLEACFSELAKLPDPELAARKKWLYDQVSCDPEAIMATLRREMARDSFLASILQR